MSRNKTTRQQDFVDVATRLFSWQKGLFPTVSDLSDVPAFLQCSRHNGHLWSRPNRRKLNRCALPIENANLVSAFWP